jgi:hypothetical protein
LRWLVRVSFPDGIYIKARESAFVVRSDDLIFLHDSLTFDSESKYDERVQ